MLQIEDLLVADVMMAPPRCLLPADVSVAEACRLLVESGVDGAPVVDDAGRMVAFAAVPDLLRAIDPLGTGRGGAGRGRRAGRALLEASAAPALQCEAGLPLTDACRRMARSRSHGLVVVDEADRVVGLVTALDVTRALACLADHNREARRMPEGAGGLWT